MAYEIIDPIDPHFPVVAGLNRGSRSVETVGHDDWRSLAADGCSCRIGSKAPNGCFAKSSAGRQYLLLELSGSDIVPVDVVGGRCGRQQYAIWCLNQATDMRQGIHKFWDRRGIQLLRPRSAT
jgi:hypothetical protein